VRLIGQRTRPLLWAWLLPVLLLAGMTARASTWTAATTYVYDAPSAARVEVHQYGAAAANPAQLSDMRERSASRSGEARGTSTTPVARSVATEAAAGGTHPLSAINPTGGNLNCGRCAIALDSTLGGSRASALGGGSMTLAEVAEGAGAKAAGWGRVRTVGSVADEIAEAGPGARGIVYGGTGTPTNAGMGHFYNVVNQGGAVTFLDGQVGRVVNYSGEFSWYAMLRTG
jgi:Papain fold toxin 1, glutamine deamidase